jgi:chromosome segregation ATPase
MPDMVQPEIDRVRVMNAELLAQIGALKTERDLACREIAFLKDLVESRDASVVQIREQCVAEVKACERIIAARDGAYAELCDVSREIDRKNEELRAEVEQLKAERDTLAAEQSWDRTAHETLIQTSRPSLSDLHAEAGLVMELNLHTVLKAVPPGATLTYTAPKTP